MEEYIEPEMVKIDMQAPGFDLPCYNPNNDSEGKISLASLNWKWVVLFFYPSDFTFVCPTELKDMANSKSKFDELGVEVLTCSTDTIFSHKAWVKHEKLMEWFPYKMLSDHNLEISDIYNILNEETWIAWRWTYVIDPEWIIRSIEVTSWPLWRNSEELLRKIEALQYMKENPSQACPARWVPWAKTITPSIKISWEIYEAINN